MFNTKMFRSLSTALLLTIGPAAGLVAQPLTDAPPPKEQKRTDLTGAPGMEVIAALSEIRPGESGSFHIHHGVEVAYVIQGALVQVPGKDPVMVPAGFITMNLRDVVHGNFKVVGETSLKSFAVYVVDKGRPLLDRKE